MDGNRVYVRVRVRMPPSKCMASIVYMQSGFYDFVRGTDYAAKTVPLSGKACPYPISSQNIVHDRKMKHERNPCTKHE